MTAITGYPLAADSLIPLMERSLPAPSSSATSSSATDDSAIKTGFEAVALLCHACMIAVGFRLVGLGEDHRIGIVLRGPGSEQEIGTDVSLPEARSPSDADPAPATEDTNPGVNEPAPRALPAEWNASSAFAFRYTHSQSSMEYLVKVTRLGSKAVVLGMAVGHDKTTSFDVAVADYISDASLPYRRHAAAPEGERGAGADERPSSQARPLQEVFISPGRIADLAALFKLKIIQPIIPGLHKEGYEVTTTATTASSSSSSRREPAGGQRAADHDPLRLPPAADPRPYPLQDPLVPGPEHRRPRGPVPDFAPPGFEDEYELNRAGGGRADWLPTAAGNGGRNPLDIGHNDLYPPGLGPNDPLRAPFLPRAGAGAGAGGGMHPTFDDPLFGRRAGAEGYDPSRPPGARYDPIGPGDEPRLGRQPFQPPPPGGGLGGIGGARGGPPNPFGSFGGGDFI